jgi:hypothetical protein
MHNLWFEYPFSQVFPIAHLMRVALPEYWLRIHSLPESKRYPENDAERTIVFNRYSQFGSTLLGEGASCLIIKSYANGFYPNIELMPELKWTPLHRIGDKDDGIWDSWMARTTWQPLFFRSLLLAIADDKEAHIAFLSTVTNCVFIPYDGGADGFSFDPILLKRLSNEFASWKSSHPAGL